MGSVRIIFSCLFLQFTLITSFVPLYAFRFDSYTQQNGLSGNLVYCINQDHEGWLWVGTDQGLSRFDGKRFRNFSPSPNDSMSINGLGIRVIYEDKKGNLWIGTENGGLNLFNRDWEGFGQPFNHHLNDQSGEASVYDIGEDRDNNLWIATNKNVFLIDSLGDAVKIWHEGTDEYDLYRNLVISKIEFDNLGRLWIGTKTLLLIMDPISKKTVWQSNTPNHNQLYNIVDLYHDSNGKMWVSTHSNGLFMIDPVSMEKTQIEFNPSLDWSKSVRQVTEDAQGNFWICTRAGIYVYDINNRSTAYYYHDEREPHSLINNSVNAVFRDCTGEMWIGTRQGLCMMAQSKQVFQNYLAHPSDESNKYLNSKTVYALWTDEKENIWVGTEDGGINKYNKTTKSYSYFNKDSKINPISENCIKAFLDDKEGNLWVGTFQGGINVINLKTGTIKQYKQGKPGSNSLSSNDVWDFALDKDGNIWIASSAGVNQYNPKTGTFTQYPHLTGNVRINWIETDSHNNIWLGSNTEVVIFKPENEKIFRYNEYSYAFLEDSKGRFWLTTFSSGLVQFTIDKGPVQYYGLENGYSNRRFFCVLEDNNQQLWISTSNGLLKFNPENSSFTYFGSVDGIQNNVFSYGAAVKSSSGELLFGGISGFVSFLPARIKNVNPTPRVYLTNFLLFNKEVPVGEKNSPLKEHISQVKELTLNHKQSVLTLGYIALNYISNEKNHFAYQLEGFEKEWNYVGNKNEATYTNLDPGEYLFKVKASTDNIHWANEATTLKIIVLPPWWKTWWFRTLLVISLIALSYLVYYIRLTSYRVEQKKLTQLVKQRTLELEETNALLIEKNKLLDEANLSKNKFFSIIAHDLKNPFGTIIGLSSLLIDEEYNLSEKERKEIILNINISTEKIYNFLENLLLWSRSQLNRIEILPSFYNLTNQVYEVLSLLEDFSTGKSIKVIFEGEKEVIVYADKPMIDTVLRNLITNAIKFSPIDTQVRIELIEENDKAICSVIDKGIGMNREQISKLFKLDKVSSTEGTRGEKGTGLGLNLCLEFLEKNGGTIWVDSKPGEGSTFYFSLPTKDEKSSKA